ncbi:L,D-transpeptidase family protein [Sphingomonas changbaiensis]|nr:L,D-transpeptidase family protein [Sphingomonas changbaiensis]
MARSTPDSVALAIRSEAGGKLKSVYAARGFWPLWVKDGAISPAADRLIAYLESADLDGLEPRNYDVRDVRGAVDRARDGSPEALARAELALSEAFARYVRDVRRAPNAKIRYLDEELVPQKLSEADALRGASLATDIDSYMMQMGWMDPAYAGLRGALADRRARWNRLPPVDISDGPMLKAGAKGERVRLLRDRLGLAPGDRFDKALAAAVTDFQAAHGLKPDGVAGAGTIAALNRSPTFYDRVLALNLDRARVLPGPDVRHITVNTAAQQLVYYDHGTEEGRMKVVVGKPSEQTPLLAGMVRYAILNPYWNVPPDLVQHKAASGVFSGATLQKAGFEALSDWSARPQLLDPEAIDWKAVASGAEQLRVRQLPGPSNAMGKVKFMFPNDLGIYLHDTPERALFDKNPRYFSSGCVRLEDAQRLGEWLFGKPLVAESDAPEQNVALPRPVPVYLTYLTAQAGDNGRVMYLDDAYGRDGFDARQVASR